MLSGLARQVGMLVARAVLILLATVNVAKARTSATPFCAFEDALFPPHYVTYKTAPGSIKVDGKLDELAWADVAWTTPNRDICGPSPCSHGPARFETRQKVRYDDEFLYVAAFLEEPQVRTVCYCAPANLPCGFPTHMQLWLRRSGRTTPSITV